MTAGLLPISHRPPRRAGSALCRAPPHAALRRNGLLLASTPDEAAHPSTDRGRPPRFSALRAGPVRARRRSSRSVAAPTRALEALGVPLLRAGTAARRRRRAVAALALLLAGAESSLVWRLRHDDHAENPTGARWSATALANAICLVVAPPTGAGYAASLGGDRPALGVFSVTAPGPRPRQPTSRLRIGRSDHLRRIVDDPSVELWRQLVRSRGSSPSRAIGQSHVELGASAELVSNVNRPACIRTRRARDRPDPGPSRPTSCREERRRCGRAQASEFHRGIEIEIRTSSPMRRAHDEPTALADSRRHLDRVRRVESPG